MFARFDSAPFAMMLNMMQIIVNGEPHEVSAGLTAAQLVDLLELGGRRLAMEINREILPRSQFTAHALCEGDRIEIVQAIGGG
jgi:sulfur carrier protein